MATGGGDGEIEFYRVLVTGLPERSNKEVLSDYVYFIHFTLQFCL